MSGPRSYSFAALGTTATVLVAEKGSLAAARSVVEAELVVMDAACSRFRDDSDLARVNRAGGSPVVVGGLFLEALRAALRAARQTEGAVDPTIGRALQLAGYDRDFSALPTTLAPRRIAIRHVPAWRQVVVDATASTVRVPAGVALDLGATAEALAADRAARAVHRVVGVGVLVSLGGDIGTAGPPPPGGWRIGVSDDHRAPLASVSQTISVVSGGLATSSTTVRRWRVGGEAAHHLIDPGTGCPAFDLLEDSQRRRRLVFRRQHGKHRGDHSRRRRARVAGPPAAACAAGGARRRHRPRRRMAGGRGGVIALAVNSRALWYLTRATGVVSLLLLTASVAFGLVGAVGWSAPGWPRFLTTGLHRNLSLLVLALLTIHIGTAVADSYAPISLAQAVIPFTSAYRPVWLGLGALAFDMLLAILLTSLIRGRLGFRTWRGVHWLAYASWPVAVVHGLGTGTDVKSTWMLAITFACATVVLGCVWWRIGTGLLAAGHRTAAAATSMVVTLAVATWSVAGPLQPGWARRAGTPLALIRSGALGLSAVGSPTPPFSARILGRLSQTAPDQTGAVTVTVAARVSTPTQGLLQVTLRGQPLPDGSIEIAAGNVFYGPRSAPSLYRGLVLVAPDGRLISRVTGGRSPLDLRLRLTVDHATGAVQGLLDADAAVGTAQTPPGTDNDAHEASI